MTPDPARPFWLDWEYDRSNADTGTRSRYGNYLRLSDASFRQIEYDDPSVEFAAAAWRVATSPIMAPALVSAHPRVVGVHMGRSHWNGEMTADVQLVSPRPTALTYAKTTSGDYYRDYHIDAWDRYEGIGENDLVGNSYLLTDIRMLWQLEPGTLPVIKEIPTGEELFDPAVDCLNVLVSALNREVGPIIERLERS